MPSFTGGNTPNRLDTKWSILQKILGATIDNGNGGTVVGDTQLVTYTSGTPAEPPDVNSAAIAYDPTGNLPTLGWNTDTQEWK